MPIFSSFLPMFSCFLAIFSCFLPIFSSFYQFFQVFTNFFKFTWLSAEILGEALCIGVRIISSPNMTGQANDGIRNSWALLTFIQHHFLDGVFSLLEERRSGARKQSQKVHQGGWTEPEPDGSVCHYSLGDGEELKQQRQSGSFRSRLSLSPADAWVKRWAIRGGCFGQ